MNDYQQFLDRKAQGGLMDGFAPTFMPDFLFDFQRTLVDWSVRKGKAAIFADCGLGKTGCQLVWAENVVRHTNKPVLILTPLAVSHQTVCEGEKFGIQVRRSHAGHVHSGINVTNYERLHYYNPDDFSGVVCDESSILKAYEGTRRQAITEFLRRMPYRLLCTATAAPNDYIELGTSSEALGELGHMDMLARFFKSDSNTVKTSTFRRGEIGAHRQEEGKWRLKGHAEEPFWRWVCSWARAIRRPSDFGFDDRAFQLPELIETEHRVESETLAPGVLFSMPAVGLQEQREERRRTIKERCERAAELVSDTKQPALMWCHLNDEGDLLETLTKDFVQVSGKDEDEAKEEKFLAFASGQARGLITKPKIGAWGLNFQHCAHITTFPSHSYEGYYQGVRRCWRFGQKRPVTVDMVTTDGELGIVKNLQRKSVQADRMFELLVRYMNEALQIERSIEFTKKAELPTWL